MAGKASLIRIGDSALLSSGNGEELDDSLDHVSGSAKSNNRGSETSGIDGQEEEPDEEETFYGSHTNEDFRTVSALDPFVAVIEKMWEIPPTTKGERKRKAMMDNDVYDDERNVRMKIQARWYFKVSVHIVLAQQRRLFVRYFYCSSLASLLVEISSQ